MNAGADASDNLLMLAWAGGDAGAFERFDRRHRGPLYRFMLRQGRDAPVADERSRYVWPSVTAERTCGSDHPPVCPGADARLALSVLARLRQHVEHGDADVARESLRRFRQARPQATVQRELHATTP